MAKDTSGPAFPALSFIVPNDLEARHVTRLGETQGMTLRDYFAAHAPFVPEVWGSKHRLAGLADAQMCAKWNYEYADAMLTERNKP